MHWRKLTAKGLAGGAERDAITVRRNERDVCQRDGCAARNRQHAAAWQMERLAHRQQLVRSAEIARVPRVQRNRTHKGTVGRVHDHAIACRAAVGGDETQIATQGIDRPRGHTSDGIDDQRVGAPGVASVANPEVHNAAAGRAHMHSQHGSTQELVRRALDARTIEQVARPRIERTEHGAQSIAEQGRRGQQHEYARRRRTQSNHRPL